MILVRFLRKLWKRLEKFLFLVISAGGVQTLNIYRYDSAPSKIKDKYNALFKGAFSFPISEYEEYWAYPRYLVTASWGNFLIASYFVVIRDGVYGDKPLRIAGLGGLVCHEYFRRRGHARRMLAQSWQHICQTNEADVGLLICADENVPFYEKIGWTCFDNTIIYEETVKTKEIEFNKMISVFNPSAITISDGDQLDLKGRLW